MMYAYTLSPEELEGLADRVKVIVLDALVRKGLLDKDEADRWAANHTLIQRKKSIFRTISNLWSKEKEEKGLMYWMVVARETHRE